MDLEHLKEEWQKSEITNKEVEAEMIRKILANRNKGALESIKKNEKRALIIIPICAITFTLCSMQSLQAGGFRMFWSLLFLPIAALLWYWSYYLCSFLDKIDLNRMSVTEVSRYINTYRIYLVRHTLGSVIFIPVYLGIWLYNHLTLVSDNLSDRFISNFIIIELACALVLFFVLIWHFYFKHIRKIRESLKELKEFEEEE